MSACRLCWNGYETLDTRELDLGTKYNYWLTILDDGMDLIQSSSMSEALYHYCHLETALLLSSDFSM